MKSEKRKKQPVVHADARRGDMRSNIGLVSHVVRAFAHARTPQPARLWCEQKLKAEKQDFSQAFRTAMSGTLPDNWPKFPLDMVERVVWLVDPARVNDMDAMVLKALVAHARGHASQTDKGMVAHLPQDKRDMVIELLARTPCFGERDGRIADPDQAALMYHSHRMGAMHRFTCSMFAPPMPQAVMAMVVRVFLYSNKGGYQAHKARRAQTRDELAQIGGNQGTPRPKPRWCPFPD